jgi:hypothetical protein
MYKIKWLQITLRSIKWCKPKRLNKQRSSVNNKILIDLMLANNNILSFLLFWHHICLNRMQGKAFVNIACVFVSRCECVTCNFIFPLNTKVVEYGTISGARESCYCADLLVSVVIIDESQDVLVKNRSDVEREDWCDAKYYVNNHLLMNTERDTFHSSQQLTSVSGLFSNIKNLRLPLRRPDCEAFCLHIQ